MNIITTSIEGVLIVEPVVYRDNRGFFMETFHQKRYKKSDPVRKRQTVSTPIRTPSQPTSCRGMGLMKIHSNIEITIPWPYKDDGKN